MKPTRKCTITGCGKPHKSRGLCATHASRLYRTGSTDILKRPTGPKAGRRLSREDVTPLAEKFWSNVSMQDGTCWAWTGPRSSDGKYGVIAHDGRNFRTHRVSYALNHGYVPPRKVVRHQCDNGLCVNPDHLLIGTQLDNVRDRDSRNRRIAPWGESNGQSKLTEEEVAQILDAHSKGENQVQLGKRFGVDRATVGRIVRGQSWLKHPARKAHR